MARWLARSSLTRSPKPRESMYRRDVLRDRRRERARRVMEREMQKEAIVAQVQQKLVQAGRVRASSPPPYPAVAPLAYLLTRPPPSRSGAQPSKRSKRKSRS